MAQDQWTLQEKGKSQKGTGARAATAGPHINCGDGFLDLADDWK